MLSACTTTGIDLHVKHVYVLPDLKHARRTIDHERKHVSLFGRHLQFEINCIVFFTQHRDRDVPHRGFVRMRQAMVTRIITFTAHDGYRVDADKRMDCYVIPVDIDVVRNY